MLVEERDNPNPKGTLSECQIINTPQGKSVSYPREQNTRQNNLTVLQTEEDNTSKKRITLIKNRPDKERPNLNKKANMSQNDHATTSLKEKAPTITKRKIEASHDRLTEKTIHRKRHRENNEPSNSLTSLCTVYWEH